MVKTLNDWTSDRLSLDIGEAVKATGAIVSGPIPLPTHKLELPSGVEVEIKV